MGNIGIDLNVGHDSNLDSEDMMSNKQENGTQFQLAATIPDQYHDVPRRTNRSVRILLVSVFALFLFGLIYSGFHVKTAADEIATFSCLSSIAAGLAELPEPELSRLPRADREWRDIDQESKERIVQWLFGNCDYDCKSFRWKPPGQIIDPWGQPLLFSTCVDENDFVLIQVVSTGPDGKRETDDDIVKSVGLGKR